MNDNIRELLVSCGWQITYDEFNIDYKNAAMLEKHIRKLISYAERGRSQ